MANMAAMQKQLLEILKKDPRFKSNEAQDNEGVNRCWR